MRSCFLKQCRPFYIHLPFEGHWKGENLDKTADLLSWLQIKTIILKCCFILFYATTRNHFCSGLDMQWKMDFMWQPVMTNSGARLRRSSKALSKAKFEVKNGHNYSLVVCCHSDPLQLSEFWQNYHIWEECSAN